MSTHGVPAVGTVTGAGHIPCDDSLRPLVRLKIYLWADNDDKGRKHMARIGERLIALGGNDVRMLDWEGAPEHGDAADFEGDLDELVANATPVVVSGLNEQAKRARLRVSADAPFDIARTFIDRKYSVGERPVLWSWKEQLWRWDGCCFLPVVESEIASEIALFLRDEVSLVKNTPKGIVETDPTPRVFNDTLACVRNLYHLKSDIVPPVWLAPPPADIAQSGRLLAVANGMLDMGAGKLHAPSSDLFTLIAVRTKYDAVAECPEWLKFLNSIWGDDETTIDVLQEMFGYLVVGERNFQKAFLVIGPPRSGKGTIGRVLRRLFDGPDTRHGTTVLSFGDFSSPFGLAPIIGRSVAIVADARTGRNSDDKASALERILAITGEDDPGIQRKFKSTFEGRLDVRFVILTNELPIIEDSSGALPSRFVIFKLTKSFEGKEDHELESRLMPEMSGILNWALEGWMKLQERGHFVMAESGQDIQEDFRDLANPLSEALRLVFREDTKFVLNKRVGYRAYSAWCEEHKTRPLNIDHFCRNLAAQGINTAYRWDFGTKTSRSADGKKAPRQILGLRLTPEWETWCKIRGISEVGGRLDEQPD